MVQSSRDRVTNNTEDEMESAHNYTFPSHTLHEWGGHSETERNVEELVKRKWAVNSSEDMHCTYE